MRCQCSVGCTAVRIHALLSLLRCPATHWSLQGRGNTDGGREPQLVLQHLQRCLHEVVHPCHMRLEPTTLCRGVAGVSDAQARRPPARMQKGVALRCVPNRRTGLGSFTFGNMTFTMSEMMSGCGPHIPTKEQAQGDVKLFCVASGLLSMVNHRARRIPCSHLCAKDADTTLKSGTITYKHGKEIASAFWDGHVSKSSLKAISSHLSELSSLCSIQFPFITGWTDRFTSA